MENILHYRFFSPEDLKKTLSIMKITVLMLFVAFFQTMAVESYSQTTKVSVKAEQITLVELFSQIEKQSEFLFFYVDNDVKNIAVNVQMKNKQIQEVLDLALQNTGLTYSINDRYINIIHKNNT